MFQHIKNLQYPIYLNCNNMLEKIIKTRQYNQSKLKCNNDKFKQILAG